MAKINSSFPYDLYKMLPKGIRDLDAQSGLILERYLAGPQEVWESAADDLRRFSTLFDIDNIEDEFLPYLKWTVGWTSDLDYITEHLTDDELRKLIRASVPLWKQKGSELGLRNALRILTGRNVVIWNWFRLRWVVGQTGFWRLGFSDPWIVGDEHGDRNEYLSTIWIMNEVGIDYELIQQVVQLARPLQEVYQIVRADFVDDFRLGRSKWTTVTAPDVTWDDENYKLVVEPGTRILANVPVLSEIDEIVWRMRVAFKDTSGGAFQLEFRRAEDIPNDRYRVTWNQDGTVELEIVDGGIGTSIDTGDVGHILAEDVTTTFGITITRTIDDDLRIKVFVYENVVIEAVLTGTDILDPGGWAICNTSAINIEVDDVIAYALPVTVDVVSASGVETRSNGVPP